MHLIYLPSISISAASDPFDRHVPAWQTYIWLLLIILLQNNPICTQILMA